MCKGFVEEQLNRRFHFQGIFFFNYTFSGIATGQKLTLAKKLFLKPPATIPRHNPVQTQSFPIMAKKTNQPPVRPYFISTSEEVNEVWSANFAAKLPSVAAKFELPQSLVDRVIANDKVFKLFMEYDRSISEWLGRWKTVRKELLDGNILTPVPAEYPAMPTFPDLQGAPTPMTNLLQPYIQAATNILASSKCTDADRELLGLVKAEGKPVPPQAKRRPKAEEFNYPILKLGVENGLAIVRIVRGLNFRGKAAILQVDRTGQGQFADLAILTGKEYADPIHLPGGQLSAAWTYRAIFIDGQTQLSDWSPGASVVVKAEPSANPIQSLATRGPATLDEAVRQLNGQGQEVAV